MRENTKLLYRQLVKELERKGNRKRAQKDRYYHKYAGYKSYGIQAPQLHTILRGHKKEFVSLIDREVFELTQLLYQSRIEDLVLASNYLLTLHRNSITPQKFRWLDKMLDYFGSWSTIDDFCVDVLPSVLLKYPKETIVLLRRWNKSKNMWKRRASVVAFVRKIGESGKFTDTVLQLCSNLIWDSEDLVQKGVGWTLKDNMRGHKKKVMQYVNGLRRKRVNSTIILYAIRDLRGREREEVLSIPPVG